MVSLIMEVLGPMQENKGVVRRYYDEVVTQGNLALTDELLSPGFVSHAPSGRSEDRQQYKAAISQSRTAFPDLHVLIEDQIAEGDKVVTRWTAQGTHTGPFIGIPPTGSQVTISAIHIHRLVDGQIMELWEQIDALGLLQQLGVVQSA